MTSRWVVEFDGVPTAREFATTQGRGTPIVVDINTGNLYAFINGAVTQVGGGSSDWTYSIKPTDQVHSDGVNYTTITGMSFLVDEPGTYAIDGKIFFATATATSSPRFTIRAPTTTIVFAARLLAELAATTTSVVHHNMTSSTVFTSFSTAKNTDAMIATFDAMATVSGAMSSNGIRIDYGPETNGVNTTVFAGSYMRWKKLL